MSGKGVMILKKKLAKRYKFCFFFVFCLFDISVLFSITSTLRIKYEKKKGHHHFLDTHNEPN